MEDLKTLGIMISQLKFILNKKQRKQMIGMLLIILVGALWEMLGVSIMLPFMQALTAPAELLNKWYIIPIAELLGIKDAKGILVLVCICIILVYLIKNIYLLLSTYLQIRYKTNVLKQLSVLMLRSYIHRPYSFFVNTNSGKIIRGVTNDVASVHDIIEIGFKMISEILVVAMIGAYVLYTDTMMALGFFIVGGLCLIIIVFGLKKRMSEMGNLNRDAIGENNKLALQTIEGIKDVLIFQKRESFLKKYERSYQKRCRASISYQLANSCPERIIETVSITGIIVIILSRLQAGVRAETFVPQLAVFAVAMFRMLPSISRVTGYINGLVYNRPALEAAYNNIKSVKEYSDKEIKNTLLKGNYQFKECVTLDNVCWKYGDDGKTILNNLSMEIRKGESVGIIGESGSGKSTLSDILLGLYKPKNGTIKVDGTSIYENLKRWGEIIGYVPQTVFLLDDTIRNNIAFGEEESKDEDIWKALEMASLKEFVEKLPNKLETEIGERGVKFSGGQRQRIAIARALYFQPDILVLDEATSALDNETEKAVMESIDFLHGKMTLFIIAHRLTTIKKCDKIYEIKNGMAILKDKSEIVN